MTLQSVIKAGEWRRAAARCLCLLLHGDTMLLLSPSGSSWAAPGEAHPCHLPLLLFIRDTLGLVAQSGGGVKKKKKKERKKKQNTVCSYYFAYPAQLCLISTAQREYIHRVFVFSPPIDACRQRWNPKVFFTVLFFCRCLSVLSAPDSHSL